MSTWIERNARGLTLTMALMVIAGAIAYARLPSGLYPELSFPRISVVATLADATSEVVLRNLTRPLEEALMPVLGVRRVRSKSIRGACELDVLFDADADMAAALRLVQVRLAEARAALPAGASVSAERITPASFPILTLNLDGAPPAELRDLAMYRIRPALSRVPGVGPVTVTAAVEREIEVEVDPARAEAAGLTVEEIARRISAANRTAVVGRVDLAYRRYAIVARGSADLGRFVVGGSELAPVRLADVARVSEGHADALAVVRSPRGEAVVINIARRIGGDVQTLDRALLAEVHRLERELEPGVRLTPVYQQAPLVAAATGAVRDAIIVGSLLAALVVLFAFRDRRATIAAALVIPASLACAAGALYVAHGSLNLMSLGGMAVAVGLVIDDAVVIMEAVHRARSEGRSHREAVRHALANLTSPVVASTLTTVIVFAPLSLLSGVVGSFFASLALALAAAVGASLALALTVVPLVRGEGRTTGSSRWAADLVRRALARPRMVAAVTVALLAVTLLASRALDTGFIPALDEGAYVLDYFTPVGTSLEAADALGGQIDAVLRADPDVATFSRRLGTELGPQRATETSRGDVIVRLHARHRPIDQLLDEQRRTIGALVPGVRIELIQLMQDMLGDLEGSPEPLELKIFGPDEAGLQREAARVAAVVREVRGTVDVFDGQKACSPERIVTIDPAAAGRLGLSTQDILSQLDAAELGVESTPVPERDRLVPVRVRWPDEARFSGEALERFRVRSSTGFVPLSELAHMEDGCAPSELVRENLRLMVAVTARLTGRDLGSASRELERRLASLHLPPGYDLELGGQSVSQRESFRGLALVIAGALALVLVVLVFQLGSVRAAVAILTAVPLALCGGVLALVVTRTALNVSSLLGAILLVGLVVKNGILLMHEALLRQRAGQKLQDALAGAVEVRLRPIVMTTACTVFGLLPLALGLGQGAELHRPLAIAVLGGLSLSTIGTLIHVPLLYARLVSWGSR